MDEIKDESDQERVLRRLEAMGIRVRRLPGGRCVLASMTIDGPPLETLNGTLPFQEFVFSTVGRDKIKCLRPQALFVLPLVRIISCATAAALEAHVRSIWADYMVELRIAEDWLRGLGADVNAASTGAMLNVSIAGERQGAKVQVNEPRKVILPSVGPLSGISLMRPQDRVLEIDPCVDSAIDLELAIAARIDELVNLDRRLKEEERRKAITNPTAVDATPEPSTDRAVRILLVGQRLANERACIDSLRLRDYTVVIGHTFNEACERYNHISPELVIADVNLGRSDGVELIASLRSVVGVEEIPVILVDDHTRKTRRHAAQQAGAIGYLTYPIQVSKIARRLEQVIKQPKRRRVTRYPQRSVVKIMGSKMPSTAVTISRGGMLVRTDDEFTVDSIQSCDLSLPELGQNLEFDAQVIYQRSEAGERGIGLQFQAMSAQNESKLIQYLHCLQ